MQYKKIIRSRKLRSSILRFFSFIPDKPMLKLQYGAAVTTLISEIVVVAMNFFFAKKIVNISFLFDGLKSLIFSNIVVVLICLLVDYYIANVYWCIGVSLVLCFIVYFLLLFLFKDKVAYPIMHNILRKYKKKKVV